MEEWEWAWVMEDPCMEEAMEDTEAWVECTVSSNNRTGNNRKIKTLTHPINSISDVIYSLQSVVSMRH